MAKQSCSSTRSRSSGPIPGLLVRLLRGVAGERVDVGEDLARLFPRVGREHRRRDLHRALSAASSESVLQLGVAHDDRGGGAVAVGRAHRPRVRVGDHDVVHDLVEREPLLVARERVERRVRVVLLGDPARTARSRRRRTVAVLHADLREHAGHRLGADAAVDRRDRAVTARAAARSSASWRARPARRAARRPTSFSTPTARPMSHSPAFTAMIAVRKRGRAGRARVGRRCTPGCRSGRPASGSPGRCRARRP